jgi:hypothetical protein
MMTLDAIKQLLKSSQNYCWELHVKSGAGGSIILSKHMPAATDEEEDGKTQGEGKAGKARRDTARLMDDSMDQLENVTRIYDESHPGAVFRIFYQGSRTAHGNGRHGPLEFTRAEQAQPASPEPQSQLSGLNQYQPAQPSFAEQMQAFMGLAGLMGQGGNQANQSLQAMWQERILQLDRREADLKAERTALNDQFRVDRQEWYDKRERELKDEKVRLQEEYDRKLEHEKEKLSLQRKANGRRRRELEEARKNLESSSNNFASKAVKTMEKAYEKFVEEDEEEAPLAGTGGAQQGQSRMATLSQALGNEVYATNDEALAQTLGMILQLHKQDPDAVAELRQGLTQYGRAKKAQGPQTVTEEEE